MRIIGFDTYDWEADGYWYELPLPFMPTVNIEPLVIPRPGTHATYGMSTLGQITFPGAFGYSGSLNIEDAFLALLTRLNPINQTVRQLRAQRNDLSIAWIPAKMRIPASSGESEDVNIYEAHFIAVDPFWTPLTATTISGTF